MRAPRLSISLAILAASATLLSPSCLAGVIVNAGGAGPFNYGWGPLNETSSQWNTDAYIDNFEYSTTYSQPDDTYYGYAHTASGNPGSVEWHYRTAPGTVFADDIAVTYQASIFSNGNSRVSGRWSTDGVNYTEFFSEGPGRVDLPVTTVSLGDSGYTGGQDLYLRFDVTGARGYVQLFRQSSPTPTSPAQTFAVNGTVFNPVHSPEPSSLVALVGMGCLGLLILARRRKWKKPDGHGFWGG